MTKVNKGNKTKIEKAVAAMKLLNEKKFTGEMVINFCNGSPEMIKRSSQEKL